MKYPVAERFKAPQGEGLYTGTPMAFIRLVGCSVGKNVCHDCDTDFDRCYEQLGGGMYYPEELVEWVGGYDHICITGGEPLNRNLTDLLDAFVNKLVHIETSGTVDWLQQDCPSTCIWLTVSPKPSYLEKMVDRADEVKVILNGLGTGPGWPTLQDAKRWAKQGKLVYIQPRNNKLTTDFLHMAEAVKVVGENPELRLSAQLHKYLRTR